MGKHHNTPKISLSYFPLPFAFHFPYHVVASACVPAKPSSRSRSLLVHFVSSSVAREAVARCGSALCHSDLAGGHTTSPRSTTALIPLADSHLRGDRSGQGGRHGGEVDGLDGNKDEFGGGCWCGEDKVGGIEQIDN